MEVVGVMGPTFRVLDHKPDLWLPLGIVRGNRTMGRFLTVIARLTPGIALQQAEHEMQVIARRLEEAHPDFNRHERIVLTPAREDVVGEVRPALLVLLGAAGMFLLIACTNVANLLLGRASTRRQEIAVRLSLGATTGRVVRQVLTESLVLSVIGGTIGLAAAIVGTRALVRSLLFGVTTTDAVTFVVVPLLLAAVGLLASYLPASRTARVDPATTLRAQ